MAIFISGIVIGLIIGGIAHNSYKKVLVMKAEDGTAEYINGKFYYIKQEDK